MIIFYIFISSNKYYRFKIFYIFKKNIFLKNGKYLQNNSPLNNHIIFSSKKNGPMYLGPIT